MAVTNIDPNLFLIMKVLDRYGHEKLPLKWKLFWMRASGKWNLYEVYDSLDVAMLEVKNEKMFTAGHRGIEALRVISAGTR